MFIVMGKGGDNMLHAKAFANATTLVALVFYTACWILSVIAPDFLFSIAISWFHTFSVESLKGGNPLDFGTFVFGGISLGVLTWVTVFTTIFLYNKWAKK